MKSTELGSCGPASKISAEGVPKAETYARKEGMTWHLTIRPSQSPS